MKLYDELVIEVTGSDLSALIGDHAYYWNGATYATTTELLTGKGYWIFNATIEPAQTLVLEVQAGSVPPGAVEVRRKECWIPVSSR